MAKQLNIFVENRPGRVKMVSEILSENHINIRAFTIQDRGNFGVIKLIVDQPQTAYSVLTEKGLACAMKNVLAIAIVDKPGNLHHLATILAENKINITDAYGFIIEPQKQGVCCMEVENPEKIREIVEQAGFTILAEEDLYEL
ncbi:MAG: hypothetical protein GX629_11205 [Phycisphaerae bacterium]|jgi:hypothetical protein|nr:hypothetical protein [Phycisphaerae bacterium]